MKLQIVPARTGVLWVRLGLQTFGRQPFVLTGLFVLYVALMSLVALVPWLGAALILALLPAATLGFMAATKAIAEGQVPRPQVLLSALRTSRQQIRAMVLLGALYTLMFLGIMGLSSLVDGGVFARYYLGNQAVTMEQLRDPAFSLAMFLALSLNLPLSLLFWHAPALVHWHGVSPVKSLFFSLVACLRNIGAFTVFGLVWFSLLMAVGTVVAIVVAQIAGPDAVVSAMLPLGAWFTALFLTSLYFTFRDSFIATEADTATTVGVT